MIDHRIFPIQSYKTYDVNIAIYWGYLWIYLK
jgi:hypothetical protein